MLGERIRQERQAQGLSQRQLCGKEITRNMLSQIESGKARPSMQTLTYLAQTLGKPVSFFLEEQTVTAEAPLLQEARQLYSRGEYRQCMTLLETGEQASPGEELRLLRILATLETAREALREGRSFYARSALESLAGLTAGAVYYTPGLERERLLLLYEAGADARTLEKELPGDDRELLLRARAALEEGDFARSKALLSALREKNVRYHFLMGKANMGQGLYREAIAHLQQAEEEEPLLCAQALEICFRELEDFKMAYIYACKQRSQ